VAASTAEAAPRRRRGPRGGTPARRREAATGFAFVGPNLVVFAAFMFLPLALTFVESLRDSSGFGPAEWVGLENYRTMVEDPVFRRSLVTTVVLGAVSLPLALGCGLGLAMLLNRRMRGRAFFRTVYFLPTVIAALAAGVVAQWMFNEELGVINKGLGVLGISPVAWQSSGFWAVTSVIVTTTWSRVGVYMVVYLAALQSIPREYYEASSVDGASRWQTFRLVTLPGLRFATGFLLVYGLIETFQLFDLIYALTRGGPGDSTNVLGLYAYTSAFVERDRGYGAAIGVVLFVILMLCTLIQWRVNRRAEED
jgi:multiple sugar transport system permease protein